MAIHLTALQSTDLNPTEQIRLLYRPGTGRASPKKTLNMSVEEADIDSKGLVN